MKIKKSELLLALEKVKPGIASKELIEQSTSFAFLEGRVTTYNDEISISHPVPGLDVEGAVKAEALYGYLNRVKQEDILIEWEDNQVVIKAGRSRAGMAFESEIKLPLKEEIGELDNWKSIPSNFIEVLKFAHPICSTDMSRPVLTCVHVTPEFAEATDGYQIGRHDFVYEKGTKKIEESFLIPASSVRDIVKYGIKEYTTTDSWVHFKAEEGTIISSRTVNYEFPDTEDHLILGDGQKFTFPDNTQEIIDRANIFAKKDAGISGEIPIVTIAIVDDGITISAKNEYGWFSEKSMIEYKDEPITFRVGSEFMHSIINKIQNCEIGEGKIGFQGKGWTYVVAMLASTGDEE